MKYLNSLICSILDLIAPPKCAVCDIKVEKINTICSNCWGGLVFIGNPKCDICSNTFPVEQFDKVCYDCQTISPAFDKVVSSVVYNDLTEKLIFGLKYNDRIDYSEIISEFIKNALVQENCLIDVLIPVPLHKNKLKKRGFNQATLISKKLMKKLGTPLKYDILLKTKDNISQSGLDREDRFKNVTGVYTVNSDHKNALKGKNICLIDDVITTGATVNECAKLLKKAGAKSVICASFARTIK